MKLGLCASTIVTESLTISGFDFLEENVQSFLLPELPDTDYERLRAGRSAPVRPVLAANCFLPGNLKCTGPYADFERLKKYAQSAFARASEAGIQMIVFGSGAARQRPDGFFREEAMDQFVHGLKAIAPMAEAAGVTVAIEPLNTGECNFINSLTEGAEAVERCGHPNIRLVADIFHMLRDRQTPDDIHRYGHLLAHVHVAENHERGYPGKSREHLIPFYSALRNSGYNKALSVECIWGADLQQEADASFAFLHEQLHEAGYGPS